MQPALPGLLTDFYEIFLGVTRMTENQDYWKELLGDEYNEELMKILQGSSEPEKPAGPANPGNGGSPDNRKDAPQEPPDRKAPEPAMPAPKAPARDKALPAKKGRGTAEPDDDFDVTFDFDGEYKDVPDNRPLRQRREKRTGCLGGLLYAVFIICICLLLASLLWLAATDVLGLGNVDETVQLTVPQGYTIDSVSDMLLKDGLIKYKFLFKLYADFSHADKKIVPGTYELNKNYDYRALVGGMSAHGGKKVEVSVTIPEGWTLKQIFDLFDSNKICPEQDLWDTAANYDFDYDFLDKSTLGDKYRLEGFLFPDTYTFYVGDTPTRTIGKMLANFKTKFKDEYTARAKELGYSVRDIVIVASMIEREAGNDNERDLVASVIYNRLKSKSFPRLEIDATIYYAIAETGEEFSTDIDSPYNTYKVKGLPAGPIANPGIASIKAALYPETTKYYYYALNKDEKSHSFFKDGDSFNAFINSDQYGG
jgi:UPF0755 protein